ncbi:MAG: class I SAM-dependent methyltransferase [Ilumatobacteraceae bacterium]
MNDHRHHHEPSHQGHGHDHDHRQAPGDVDWEAIANMLEFEGEMLSPHIDDAIRWARELCLGGAPSRVVDLGSGPGVASVRLATEFADATVLAVDGSDGLLQRARQRAAQAGVADRFSTAVVDLSDPAADSALTTAVDGADLVWVSMVLHHVPDPAHVLSVLRPAMASGGVVIIAEFGSPLRVLPTEAVTPDGLFERIDVETARSLAEHVGGRNTHADWSALLIDAGFENLGTQDSAFDVDAPLDAAHREWAQAHLRRVRSMSPDRLDAADLAAIDDLLDLSSPLGLATRSDALIRTSRLLTAGRA